ncbi:MAG: hypothetical protein EHM60_06525 [Lysobacterales bacterium]|jgi:hypothetical protein|nr:MAG: hypothetical protein EHM60_06525 [Xanthomonadales bacterium]
MRPQQQTLAASWFERYRKRTQHEQLLAEMNQSVPWDPLVGPIAAERGLHAGHRRHESIKNDRLSRCQLSS